MKTMATYSRSDDLIASYSSKGPSQVDHIVKPDVVAPGNQVVSLLASKDSTWPTQFPQTQVPMSYYVKGGSQESSTKYFRLSGTSMATPVVSGAAALMLQQHSNMTPIR